MAQYVLLGECWPTPDLDPTQPHFFNLGSHAKATRQNTEDAKEGKGLRTEIHITERAC
jgi:hypothetical protein